MNNILELSNKIDKETDFNNKMTMINELNSLIEKQKDYYNEMIMQINSKDININIESKYKKKSIDDLEELFNNSNNIEDKINIYNAINKYYNYKLKELLINE
jgi:hypothetical protein